MLEREVGESASAMGSDTKHSPRGMLNHPGRPGKLYCGLVALCYMALAVALLFFNKAALSSYKFPNANVITLAQLACSNVLLYAFRKLGWVRFSCSESDSQSITNQTSIALSIKGVGEKERT